MGVDKKIKEDSNYNEGIPEYYFSRDVFEKTKAQRLEELRIQQFMQQQAKMEAMRRQQRANEQGENDA